MKQHAAPRVPVSGVHWPTRHGHPGPTPVAGHQPGGTSARTQCRRGGTISWRAGCECESSPALRSDHRSTLPPPVPGPPRRLLREIRITPSASSGPPHHRKGHADQPDPEQRSGRGRRPREVIVTPNREALVEAGAGAVRETGDVTDQPWPSLLAPMALPRTYPRFTSTPVRHGNTASGKRFRD